MPNQWVETALEELVSAARNISPWQVATPLDVAHVLAELGIKGYKSHDSGCPIAVYLFRKTGLEVRISARTYYAPEPGTTPDVVAEFVSNFDIGAYPFLLVYPL